MLFIPFGLNTKFLGFELQSVEFCVYGIFFPFFGAINCPIILVALNQSTRLESYWIHRDLLTPVISVCPCASALARPSPLDMYLRRHSDEELGLGLSPALRVQIGEYNLEKSGSPYRAKIASFRTRIISLYSSAYKKKAPKNHSSNVYHCDSFQLGHEKQHSLLADTTYPCISIPTPFPYILPSSSSYIFWRPTGFGTIRNNGERVLFSELFWLGPGGCLRSIKMNGLYWSATICFSADGTKQKQWENQILFRFRAIVMQDCRECSYLSRMKWCSGGTLFSQCIDRQMDICVSGPHWLDGDGEFLSREFHTGLDQLCDERLAVRKACTKRQTQLSR